MRQLRRTLLVIGVLISVVASGGVGSASSGTKFGPPVKLTPDYGGGYEPAVLVDKYGNIFATAHKEVAELVVSPDMRSPTLTRSMSWAWVSTDNGKTFQNIPGYPLGLETHDFGDEGDLALDDANHLYFVDTNVADITFTRWSVTGRGQISIDLHRPLIPTAEPVDDRPWVTAHGDGHVFYFGNEGDKGQTYPLGQDHPGAAGPGRYTVYSSYDGGLTWDSIGYQLDDSGWCRPAADHRPGSKFVYAFCTNDEGLLYSYVTADDGHTWNRYTVGKYNPDDATYSWPTVEVAPDGSVWGLYTDGEKVDADGIPSTNRIWLYHSTDHGKTWTRRDITPMKGRYEYGWIDVSFDGKKLGFGTYYRKNNSSPWYVYGTIFDTSVMTAKTKTVPLLTALDPANAVAPASSTDAPHDLMSSSFGPDGHLSVVWHRSVIMYGENEGDSLYRDCYYARSL
jgi:hypothetical protein